MPQRRFLLASHDAGGTIPPMLALAEALVAEGHDVTWLGQPSIRHRAETAGCRFCPWTGVADYAVRVPLEEQIQLTLPLITGSGVGQDLLDAAGEHDPAVMVIDANLAGAAAAAESSGHVSAILLHSMYKTFVDTWFADLWPLLEPAINATRADFGLRAVNSWAEVFEAHGLLLSVVPECFDAPVTETPRAMRHVGFLVPTGGHASGQGGFDPGAEPAVLVGLSTTYLNQEGLMQTILDGLGQLEVRGLVTTAGQVDPDNLRVPPNVVVRDYVDHRRVLSEASVMVTHAGLGSVAAAASFGVPMVCAPIGRDQHLNAERVADLCAGVVIDATASSTELAEAVMAVTSEPRYHSAASKLSQESLRHGGPPAAAAEVVTLVDL